MANDRINYGHKNRIKKRNSKAAPSAFSLCKKTNNWITSQMTFLPRIRNEKKFCCTFSHVEREFFFPFIYWKKCSFPLSIKRKNIIKKENKKDVHLSLFCLRSCFDGLIFAFDCDITNIKGLNQFYDIPLS